MKSYNPIDWKSVSAGSEHANVGSKVVARLAAPGALYLKTGKSKKQLIGYGDQFNVVIEGTSSPVLEATQDAVFFVNEPREYRSKGVPHTNADKRTEVESATEALIRSAERRIALRERESARKMRADFNMMLRKRKEEGLQDEAPEPVEGDDDFTPPPPATDAPDPNGETASANS
jgi:hypothetical protein